MPYDDIANIMRVACFIGLVALIGLAVAARRIAVSPSNKSITP
jgi:hypothetical protein